MVHSNRFQLQEGSELFTSTALLLLTVVFFATDCATTYITDNSCTFNVEGKLFTLAYLNQNKADSSGYYSASLNS